jgi:hypothetical protein
MSGGPGSVPTNRHGLSCRVNLNDLISRCAVLTAARGYQRPRCGSSQANEARSFLACVAYLVLRTSLPSHTLPLAAS